MQWFQDEKVKHRVIGLAVLMSMALVFVPAMVKKSNQRLDRSMNLSLNLPPKPAFPNVIAVKPQALFKTVKVAHVDIPEVSDKNMNTEVARAESLSGQTMATRSIIQKSPVMATTFAKADKKAQEVAMTKPVTPTNRIENKKVVSIPRVAVFVKPSTLSKTTTRRNELQRGRASVPVLLVGNKSPSKTKFFSVQVASFSRQDNALSLVRSLQKKGYKATYDKQGSQYRVLVGELGQRDQAKYLQHKLASAAQLTGFIVKVG